MTSRPTLKTKPVLAMISGSQLAKGKSIVLAAAIFSISGAVLSLCQAEGKLDADPSAANRSPGLDFGPNVLVFDPSMFDLQSRLDAIFNQQERSQFGSNRYAYLFKPGKYSLDVQVGFYTQVLGLGKSPDDVLISGAVRSKARWMANHNATCNFWRCVENLSVIPTEDRHINIWAVSQGTALRRVHVQGDLNLWDGGWSRGGFLADCKIDGQVNSGSQQQWFSRDSQWGSWTGANWNMVFVGIARPPSERWPDPPYTVIDETPVIREKPYLFIVVGRWRAGELQSVNVVKIYDVDLVTGCDSDLAGGRSGRVPIQFNGGTEYLPGGNNKHASYQAMKISQRAGSEFHGDNSAVGWQRTQPELKRENLTRSSPGSAHRYVRQHCRELRRLLEIGGVRSVSWSPKRQSSKCHF